MAKTKSTKRDEKIALEQWAVFVDNMRRASPVDLSEGLIEKKKRIAELEKDDEAWFQYYFPNYYSCEPAPFHIRATRRVMNNPDAYEVRSWARSLAKSARTMMEVMKLALTGKKKNILMISASKDNAEDLLTPYRLVLEKNDRIVNDYGVQQRAGSWEGHKFVTRKGVSFRAIGAGQSPRGTRNEEKRPDVLLFDDIDTDEECRNSEIIKNKVKWIEEAAIGTRDVSEPMLIIACGNIIAKYSCITEMGKKADKWDIVNIRDTEGKSTWSVKNTEAHIDRCLSIISYESGQKEYFNNPMSGSDTFKDLKYGKCPTLKSCDAVIVYNDPATSNKDTTAASSKCCVIIGAKSGIYYVYRVWLDQMSNAKFVDYIFEADDVLTKAEVDPKYIFIENNSLQDPFYEQVIIPLIKKRGKEVDRTLLIRPDERKKPEKYTRIEGTLEPLNRLGHLVFNEKEQDDPHMKRLIAQFENFNPKQKLMDGPDCVEGGVWLIKEKKVGSPRKSVFSRKESRKY